MQKKKKKRDSNKIRMGHKIFRGGIFTAAGCGGGRVRASSFSSSRGTWASPALRRASWPGPRR